jgi:hypothetical protein
MSEIRLRAVAQIGRISRELEKAERQRGEHGYLLPTDGNQVSKADQLKAAGISTSTANRYEQLASPSAQAAPVVEAAMENYLASAAAEEKQPTFGGLCKAVRQSLVDTGVITPVQQHAKFERGG